MSYLFCFLLGFALASILWSIILIKQNEDWGKMCQEINDSWFCILLKEKESEE